MTTLLPTAEQVQELHDSYNQSTGYAMPLRPQWQKFWYDAFKDGITPEIIVLVIKDRQKRIAAGVRHKESLLIRNLVGDEDAIANTMNEGYALLAMKRRIIDPARASVLKATGRAADHGEPDQGPRLAKECLAKGLEQLKQAVNQ